MNTKAEKQNNTDEASSRQPHKPRLKQFSVYSNVILGVIGAALTAFLITNQIQIGKLQHKIARQQVEIQVAALVKDFIPSITKHSREGEEAREVINAAVSYLSEKYESTLLAELTTRLLEKSSIPSTESSVMQINEATQAPASTTHWFAVLASYGGTQLSLARQRAQELQETINKANFDHKIEIYKTKISNNFAITLDGPMTKSEAIKLAALARSNGWTKDAFAQVDREWAKVK